MSFALAAPLAYTHVEKKRVLINVIAFIFFANMWNDSEMQSRVRSTLISHFVCLQRDGDRRFGQVCIVALSLYLSLSSQLCVSRAQEDANICV